MSAIPYRSRGTPNSMTSGRGSNFGQGDNQSQEEEKDDAPQRSNGQRVGMMSLEGGGFHGMGNQQGIGSQWGIGSGNFPFMGNGNIKYLRGSLGGNGQRGSGPVPNMIKHNRRHGGSRGRLDRLRNWQQNMPPNSHFGVSGNFNGAGRPRLGFNIPGFLPQQQAAGPPLGASSSGLSPREQLYQKISMPGSGGPRNSRRGRERPGGGEFGRRTPKPSDIQQHRQNIPPWMKGQLQQQQQQNQGEGADEGGAQNGNTSASGGFDAYHKQMEELQRQRGRMGRWGGRWR